MRDYVILTDSCCDLSAEMAAELGVEVLPLSLQMGDRTYRNYLDGREIGFHEFYERVRSGELATTSAVNVGEFEEKMREILKTGKDILSISFSSRPLHHLPVLRHCRGGVEGRISRREDPDGGLPLRLSGAGIVRVSLRAGAEKGENH